MMVQVEIHYEIVKTLQFLSISDTIVEIYY